MKKFEIDYDKKGDVLYLVFERVKDEYGEEIAPGVYVHFESKTKKPTGITIIGFAKVLQKKGLEVPLSR